MLGLRELKKKPDIIFDINWDMTPEEAVTLYLEWGNNWTHGKYPIRSKNDTSVYFVLNTWESPPRLFLIRRNSEGAEELASLTLPKKLSSDFLKEINHNKGVYPPPDNVKNWLKKEPYGPDTNTC